jgi:hypothetical protein
MESDIVKFVRLTTGEDLITQVTEFISDDDHHYVLMSPMKILYLTGKTGSMTISLMQWVFNRICDKQTFTIYPEDVLMVADATDDIIEYYWDSISFYDDMTQTKKEERESSFIEAELDDKSIDDDTARDMITEMLETIRKDRGKLH